MRKVLIISLCVAVMGTTGLGAYLFFAQRKSYSVEDILPQGPVMFIHLSDIPESVGKITSSRLWQKISSIDYDTLIEKGFAKEEQKMLYGLIKNQLLSAETISGINEFFGREVAFAVYPVDMNMIVASAGSPEAMGAVMEEAFSKVVLVTRLKPDAQIKELISKTFGFYGKDIPIEYMDYNGQKIQVVTVSPVNIKVAFVRLGNLLVMGLGEKAAQTSIDTFKKSQRSLAQDVSFVQVQKRFVSGAGLEAYFNMGEFFLRFEEQMKNWLSSNQDSQGDHSKEQINQVLDNFRGLKAMGASIKFDALTTIDYNLVYSLNDFSSDIAKQYANCVSVENKSLSIIPRDVLGYSWGSCFDLSYYWNQFKTETEKSQAAKAALPENSQTAPTLADQVKTIEQALGLSIESDVLPSIGKEVGGYLADVDLSGAFPVPGLVLFIKIENQEKIEKLLNQLTQNPMLVVGSEEYQQHNIRYLSLPLGNDLQPGYAVVNNYLLVAVKRQSIKDSIDALKDSSRSLSANAGFQAVNAGLTDKNVNMQYVQMDQAAKKLGHLLEWLGTWMQNEERKRTAFQSGAKLKLEEVQKSLTDNEKALTDIQSKIDGLNTKIQALQAQAADVTVQQTELAALEESKKTKQQDIASGQEQKAEQEFLLKGFESSADANPQQRQFYFDNLLSPVLDALTAISAIGSQTTNDGNVLQSTMHLKLE